MLDSGDDADSLGLRVRALRKHLGLSQERLAELAGVHRVDVVRVESGANKGSSYALRAALARGFELSIEDVAAYLDGQIGIEQALARRAA